MIEQDEALPRRAGDADPHLVMGAARFTLEHLHRGLIDADVIGRSKPLVHQLISGMTGACARITAAACVPRGNAMS